MKMGKAKIVGLCECGCGLLTTISKQNHVEYDWIKGQPKRFIRGHNRRGQKVSQEQKEKISFALTGKSPSNETRNKISAMLKGRKFTPEWRRKLSIARRAWTMSTEHRKNISLALKGKKRGRENPAWKGGISYEPYGSEFTHELKIQIRRRDNFTCQKCGRTEKEELANLSKALHVHHIDYVKKNCVENNLIALCCSCNLAVNSNRKYWQKFFETKRLNLEPWYGGVLGTKEFTIEQVKRVTLR